MTENVIALDLEKRLELSLKRLGRRSRARVALQEAGYESVKQSARGFLADCATSMRAYLDMGIPMDTALHARCCLLVEAAIEKLDDTESI